MLLEDLKIGELFAGIGGMGLGVQQVLDAEVSWTSEFDDHASRVLAYRFPDAPNFGDITKIKWTPDCPSCSRETVVRWYDDKGFYWCEHCESKWTESIRTADIPAIIHILTGGSPCQDLSHAGIRLGMKHGTRSGLWVSMLEAIKKLRPKLVMWENVRGAYSAEATSEMEPCPGCVGHGDGGAILRALGRVLGDLSSVGYDAEWHGIRAADVGACHNRFRVFVTAWPRGTGKPRLAGRALTYGGRGEILADPNGIGLEAGGLTGRPKPEVAGVERDIPLLPTPAVNDMGAGKEIEARDLWAARQKSATGRPAPHGKSLHIEALRMLPTPSANVGMNGGSQHPDKRRAGGHQPSIKDVVEHLLPTPKSSNNENRQSGGYGLNLGGALALLPTPRASDGVKGGPNQRGSKGDYMLPGAVHNLLPTPAVADTQGGRKSRSGSRSDELLLNGIAAYDTWGEYAPAIHRWESVFGVPAPDPTLPTGRDGKPQLSALFTEWMQGFPPGWNTDPDIWDEIRPSTARNQQLKQHGNAVNPPQLAAVLRHVLTT